jgi:hypothetical protein
MNARNVDGRWLALLLLAGYLAWLLGGGADYRERWKQLGVVARPVSFVDLYVFPAARTELAAGRDPALANPTDPMKRPYNYPRVWLAFMRHPADAKTIAVLGTGMALAALAAVLACWGRLAPGAGLLGGLLLCSPAVMLGVERGNTDQLVFCLVAAGILLGWETGPARRLTTTGLWLAAAGLKLYPAVAFAAWGRRPWPVAWRRLLVPGLILAAYLLLFREEIRGALRTTGSGWVVSYGAGVPAKALVQAAGFYRGLTLDANTWRLAFTALAVAGVVLATRQGWRLGGLPRPAGNEADRSWRGFQVGALIYVGTFLAGDNFDYRQLFLLPVLPALWALATAGGRGAGLARAGIVCLLFSTGMNFLLGGWPGFVLNELGGWGLAYVLTALLVAERAGAAGRVDAAVV